MRIRYVIGTKCNFNCEYCIITKKGNFLKETTNDDTLFQAIRECENKNKNIERILITGGEPCLYKDRVLNILKQCNYIPEIAINTNCTYIDMICEFLKFKNVHINISWDGHQNNRTTDIYNNLKILVNKVGYDKITINYVLTPTSTINLYENMLELEKIKPGLSYKVNFGLVIEEYEYYKDFNIEILKEQLEKIFLHNPNYNIFRKKERDCGYLKNNGSEYIDIQTENIYYGCCSGISLYNVVTNIEQMFFCKELDNDMCMKCKNEFCDICGVKLNKISKGHSYNKKNFFCIFYSIISDIYYKYENYIELINQIIRGQISLLELLLTENCNLNCSYCFEHKLNKNIIDKKIIDIIIKILSIRKLSYNEPIEILFFGGEPLLPSNVKIILYLLDQMKKYNLLKMIKISFITNLYWFDDTLVNLLKRIEEEQILHHIQVSLDGICKSNDFNRKTYSGQGTFNKVLKNILNLNQYINYQKISINCVINENTINFLDKNILFFDNLLKNNIVSGISFRQAQTIEHTLDKEYIELYYKNYKKVFDLYIKNQISEQIFMSAINYNNFNNTKIGCGIFQNFITIDQYGNLIPCHRIIGEDKEKYIISNILKPETFFEFDKKIDLYKKELNFYSELKKCEECQFSNYCIKCKVAYLSENKEINKVFTYICQIVHIIGSLLNEYNINFHKELIKSKQLYEMKNSLEELYNTYNSLKLNNSINDFEEIEILNALKILSDDIRSFMNE